MVRHPPHIKQRGPKIKRDPNLDKCPVRTLYGGLTKKSCRNPCRSLEGAPKEGDPITPTFNPALEPSEGIPAPKPYLQSPL